MTGPSGNYLFPLEIAFPKVRIASPKISMHTHALHPPLRSDPYNYQPCRLQMQWTHIWRWLTNHWKTITNPSEPLYNRTASHPFYMLIPFVPLSAFYYYRCVSYVSNTTTRSYKDIHIWCKCLSCSWIVPPVYWWCFLH